MEQHWQKPLKNVITPKRGPLPQMFRLIDANRALIGELPHGYLKRTHWMRAGRALMAAADSGGESDIAWAYEMIVGALIKEDWL